MPWLIYPEYSDVLHSSTSTKISCLQSLVRRITVQFLYNTSRYNKIWMKHGHVMASIFFIHGIHKGIIGK